MKNYFSERKRVNGYSLPDNYTFGYAYVLSDAFLKQHCLLSRLLTMWRGKSSHLVSDPLFKV